jgi:F0F1-type ATP synthase membrane subunit b/b'
MWHYSEDGAQYGPVEESEIIRMIQSGDILPSTLVCSEGGTEWRSAREYECFQVEVFPKGKEPIGDDAVATPLNGPQSLRANTPVITASAARGSPPLASVGSTGNPMSILAVISIVVLLVVAAGSVVYSASQRSKLKSAERAKYSARSDAAKAQESLEKIQGELQNKAGEYARTQSLYQEKVGELHFLKNKYDGITGVAAQAQAAQSKAAADLAKTEQDLQELYAQMSSLQAQARAAAQLQTQLTDFQNLGLSAAEIQQRLVELKQLKNAARPPTVKKKPKPKVNLGEVAKVGVWDAANKFGVFHAGAENGIKVGDKFTIFRDGAAIGKIVVQRVTPVLSVFEADPAFGQPQSPYKIGDSVMKTN